MEAFADVVIESTGFFTDATKAKAHLDGGVWPHHEDCKPGECSKKCKGEAVNGSAFRQCFRMVTQAVKGLGMPSDQKKPAEQAIVEEVAAALKATRETVALAPGSDEETEH